MKDDYNLRFLALKDWWLRENRGLLVQVAKELGCTPRFVRLVYRDKRRSQRVELALSRIHAPGFKAPKIRQAG